MSYKSLFILVILSLNLLVSPKLKTPFPETKQELRAVWVTPLEDAELITYKSKEDFMKNMNYLLDTLKYYNMNAIVYHIRTHNDAMYKSKLNPISPFFKLVNFDEFDPLKWLIAETHKRGIEFHAWLNPYRVKAKGGVTKEEVAQYYKEQGFTNNPASDVANLLLGMNGSTTPNTAYMNPGLPNVRKFIADTIEEIMTNYNVDAIHFDDYFYYNMGTNGQTEGEKTILIEEDQELYLNYISGHHFGPYKGDSARDKADWRREQVNQLIQGLHNVIKNFNRANKKYIQFGISPSGVWKSGDGIVTYADNGDAISKGSKTTTTFEHYGCYLFANTLYWINKEWIDYMLPQTYWSSDHPMCPYIDLMDWWNRVVKYKKVNAYSGHGLFMSAGKKSYAWTFDEGEFTRELKFIKESMADGSCVYHFEALRKYRDGVDCMASKQVKNAFIDNSYWKEKVIPSRIKAFEEIKLEKVKDFKVEGNVLSFKRMEEAKFYAVYRKEGGAYLLLDIIGGDDERIIYKDVKEGKEHNVRAVSYSNTLGEPL